MQTSQAQKPRKDDNTSQAFNDVLKSLLAVLDKLIRDFSALVVIFIFGVCQVFCGSSFHHWGTLPAHSMAKQLRAGFQLCMGMVHFLAIFWMAR